MINQIILNGVDKLKKVSQLMFGALAALSISTTVVTSIGAVSADTIADTKASISTANTENTALLTKLNAAQNKVAAVNNQVSDKVIAIDAAQKAITTTNDKIVALGQQIDKTQTEVKARKAVLKEQVVALQKQTGDSVSGNVYIDFIVNSDSFSDMVSRASVVGKLNQANKEAMTAVADSESKLADLKADQVAKKANLEATKTQLENDKTQLVSLKSDAEKQQADFQKEVDGHQTQLANLQSQLDAQTQAAVAAAQKATATKTATPVVATKQDSNDSKQAQPSNVNHNEGAQVAETPKSSANTGSLVGNALQFQGTPYKWGGATPGGFDCSGLVYYAAKLAGMNLPRTSQAQSKLGTNVALSDLQPGDLVFWGGVGSAYHVGIYIGGGSYVHAPAPGQNVTTMSMQYYKPDFGRRL